MGAPASKWRRRFPCATWESAVINSMRLPVLLGLVFVAAFSWVASLVPISYALDSSTIRQLADEDSEVKLAAISEIVALREVSAIPLLRAMQDDTLRFLNDRLFVVADEIVKDAVSGETVKIAPESLEAVVINNRLRTALDSAIAALNLLSANRAVRLEAANAISNNPPEEFLPLIKDEMTKESDADVKALLARAAAVIEIKSPDARVRRGAIKLLVESDHPETKQILLGLLQKNPDGSFAEPDAALRGEAQRAIAAIDQRHIVPQILGTVFYGLSLGSILLLAALGLAITFGLMGIINMAHGEMLMIGAYATYVVQQLFRNYLPQAVDGYILAAVPAAFIISAAVGILIERAVIRHLYGRPLETLLTTWGISLILIQFVRMLFGAQNVEVANPSWMSGGLVLGGGIVLPYNRIAIIGFSALVVLIVWLFLARTRLGLYVRAVTQNRTMADCMGIRTARIDWLTFGLGSGIAGLGGVALSQVGNVGPDLGQSYIIDSFMVVVLGGVGQLAGTIIAALGLGEINKFLEPFTGAVLGKIFVLILIILFIQKRPQGMFALKGRTAES